MRPERIEVTREIRGGNGAAGSFRLGDAAAELEAICGEYAGRVKLIYLDPPYMTGDRFGMKVRVGAEQWRTGNGKLRLETFSDRADRESYLALLRTVLVGCRTLLSEDGMLFLHVDYRVNAHVRLLLDEIFGETSFVNEIIWTYQSGGRSVRHFSRKHDTIFLYRKTEQYDFHIEDVMVVPDRPKSNHMRRHVDPDGRVYRSIRSGGKVYTYYDDDPVAPSDVWTDLSHLQQRDPERTGYDTQKPLALLNRIVRCSTRPGDLVMDLFAGSGTTLEAAQLAGRRFFGMDLCVLTANIMRRRLDHGALTLELPHFSGQPECEVSCALGVGFCRVGLVRFMPEPGTLPEGVEGLDAVEGWSVGYVRDDGYHVMAQSLRSRRRPELLTQLELPVYAGKPALCVCTVKGESYYYSIDNELFKYSSQ